MNFFSVELPCGSRSRKKNSNKALASSEFVTQISVCPKSRKETKIHWEDDAVQRSLRSLTGTVVPCGCDESTNSLEWSKSLPCFHRRELGRSSQGCQLSALSVVSNICASNLQKRWWRKQKATWAPRNVVRTGNQFCFFLSFWLVWRCCLYNTLT